jgi:anti-sigma regulatory factor (Ser/Thr protein kinase)
MHEELHLTIRNDLGELARVNDLVSELLERCGIAPEVLYATQLVLEEVLSNVIRHGCQDGEPHGIALTLSVGESAVELGVVDDGREFDPTIAESPRLDLPLEDWRVGGLGIHLVRAYAREMRYERVGHRNALWLRI